MRASWPLLNPRGVTDSCRPRVLHSLLTPLVTAPLHVAAEAWSFATLQAEESQLLEDLFASSGRIISEFAPYELTNTAWATSRLKFVKGSALDGISAQALRTVVESAVGVVPEVVTPETGVPVP